MPASRNKRQRERNPYFKESYDTAEEGAKAKADYLMNTVLKNFDWDAFMAQKQARASEK